MNNKRNISPFIYFILNNWVLFGLGLTVYIATRVVGLIEYPIYFFTDEAIQTVSAAELVRDEFFGPGGVFLPTYFQNGSFYNLSLSVYIQVFPYLLFGKSILITRLTSVIYSLIAVLCITIIAKSFLKLNYWWIAPYLFSIIPAWFLHSRTAFETVLFSSFFAGFMLMYFCYRKKHPAFIFLVIIFAFFSFFSYSPGQVVIVFSGVVLFFVDIKFHWRNRWWLVACLPLILFGIFPYLRFVSQVPDVAWNHLEELNSFVTKPLPLSIKLKQYITEYLQGLNPFYWFIQNEHDLPRHLMKNYGHIQLWLLPFFLYGCYYAIKHIKQDEFRILLVTIFAAPTGSALVGIGITRVLVFIIPACLLILIGFCHFIDFILKYFIEQPILRNTAGKSNLLNQEIIQIVLLILLLVFFLITNVWITADALVNGPTWYEDYGLYGMQYGVRQIYTQLIPKYLSIIDRDKKIFLSSIWANGADVFPRFFLDPEEQKQIQLGSIDMFLFNQLPLEDFNIFILTPEEFDQVLVSKKMHIDKVEEILPYPNNKAGFYALKLSYIQGVEEIFLREAEARKIPNEETIVLDNQSVKVIYSQIDSGQLMDIFDGNSNTLIRALEANPYLLTMEFSSPIRFAGLSADFGSMDFDLDVTVESNDSHNGNKYIKYYRDMPDDPHIDFMIDQPIDQVNKLIINIFNINSSPMDKIHIRELKIIYN